MFNLAAESEVTRTMYPVRLPVLYKRLVWGLDCFGGSLDELHHVVRVRDHGHVVGGDFDRGGPHALGELALGVGRDGLIALGDQEPGRQQRRIRFGALPLRS